MCIVPGLGFNHRVRGFARTILAILGGLGGFGLGLLGILFLDQKYHAFWMPAAFCVAITFLLGFLPGLKPALRWGYALFLSGATCTAWMISRPKMHKDLMDHWYRMGPKGAGIAAALGFGCFAIAYAMQKKRPRLFWMLLLVVEACLVGYFSSALGGSPHTVHLLQWLFHMDAATADRISPIIRKSLHFTFYGIIGYSALSLAKGSGVSGKAVIALGIAFAFCYASFDETRQSDSDTRGASVWDVALDVFGATTFCLIGSRGKSSKPRKKAAAA